MATKPFPSADALAAWLKQVLTLAKWHWPLLPGLLLAVALRFWSLTPAFLYGDEAEYAAVARSLADDPRALAYPALEGFPPTPFVSQPPLLLYLFAFAGVLTGSFVTGPLVVSALLGAGTVALVYAIGVVARDRWMGGLAATFLAVLPFHISVSRSAQLDAGFTFFFTLTILLFLLWLRRPTLGASLGLGGAAAATALAKLPGILVLVPLVIVVLARSLTDLRLRRDRDLRVATAARVRLRATGLQVLAAGLPMAVAALAYLTHLWALRATGDLVRKLGWQAERVQGGAGTAPRGWDWYFTSELSLTIQWGFVLAVLGAVGLVMAFGQLRHRDPVVRWTWLTMLLWPLVVLGFLVASQRKEWFYALPLSPPVVLLAALPVHAAALRAWKASLPQPGQTWWRTPGAVLAVAGLAAVAGFAPLQSTVQHHVWGSDYGYGLAEAAEWIQAEDPQAAQVGTTLGRFSLHFYNGQPTYHYYLNHTWIDERVASGDLRYVVRDPYLLLDYEEDWLDGLLERHGAELVKLVSNGRGAQVEVYRVGNATV